MSVRKTLPKLMTVILLFLVFMVSSAVVPAIASRNKYVVRTAPLASDVMSSPPTAYTHANGPAKLAVILAPSKVLADSSTKSYAVCVQIQDTFGNPAAATKNTVVLLTSSNTTVGTISDSMTIYKGDSSAYASFTSTYAPGTTTITATAVGLASGSADMTTVGAVASKLAVILAPNKLPNDGAGHSYVVCVQIQDAYGNPALATEDTGVLLRSSDPTVGTVTDSVTIYKGSHTAYATFYSTTTPGSTIITAYTFGLASGSAVMTTVTGLTPTKLAVILAPLKLRNDNKYHYYPVKVQLQDANGDPALAATDTYVTLTSSNTTVGTVPGSLTIYSGKNHASTSFTTTYTPGSTTITAAAVDYTSGSADMTMVGAVASKLAVILAPSKLPNDNKYHYYPVKVQLQDANGDPALAPMSTSVLLTSSDTTVGTVPSSVTISAGKSSNYASFTTTYKVGSTTITAAAAPYTSGSADMTMVGAVASKLAVILAPSKLPNDNKYHYYPVKVQLQDAYGNPALAPVSTVVTLTSSNTTVGTVPSTVTISAGKSHASTSFTTTYTPGSTTITAAAVGYTSGSAVMTTGTGLTPAKLAVFAAPHKLPNDNKYHYYSVVVQLQDANGDPALAPANTPILLISSNRTVGTVPVLVTIYSGSCFAYATFTSTYAPGLTEITAITIDYTSGSAFMVTGRWYLGISIYTDKYSYITGETMNVGLDVSNPGAETDVSVKVWLELPTGATYTMLSIPSVTLPAGLSYSNPTQWTFPLPSISTGIYIWHAVLDDPITGAILSEDTAVWEFT